MAKVGLWLRGARGKLAGSVLSKGEYGTIARELVTPRNAQTRKQMLQRVAFATTVQAAKFMLPVIGQTFEGQPNERRNRRQFIRQNVNRLKRQYIYYNGLNNNTPVTPDLSAANAKGVQQLVPNNYIISQGSLPMPDVLKNSEVVHDGESSMAPHTSQIRIENKEHMSALELFTTLFSPMKPGDQLTACYISCAADPVTDQPIYEAENGDVINYSAFTARRIVFKDASAPEWNTDGEIGASLDKNHLIDWLTPIFDEEKTDQDLKEQFLNMLSVRTPGQGEGSGFMYIDIDSTLITVSDTLPYSSTNAFGLILSRMVDGQWRYSNSEMIRIWYTEDRADGGYYGLKYPQAVITYMKSSDANSDLFTRTGGYDNEV